jgi:hypothetical protein
MRSMVGGVRSFPGPAQPATGNPADCQAALTFQQKNLAIPAKSATHPRLFTFRP